MCLQIVKLEEMIRKKVEEKKLMKALKNKLCEVSLVAKKECVDESEEISV